MCPKEDSHHCDAEDVVDVVPCGVLQLSFCTETHIFQPDSASVHPSVSFLLHSDISHHAEDHHGLK